MALDTSLSRSSLAFLGFLFLVTLKLTKAYLEKAKLDHIPTVGPNGLLTSYLTTFRWVKDATGVIEEGYRLYPGGIFKVPTISGWQVVLNGTNLVNDVRKASDDQMSVETQHEILQTGYTIHPQYPTSNHYQVEVTRTPLTRNIGARFADVHDEVQEVMSEKIPLSDDWTEFRIHEVSLDIVVRAVNRFFVGLPLCRDPDWCDLNIKFTLNVVINSLMINFFPKFVHPIVGRIFTGRKSGLRRAMKHLRPIIEERLKLQEQLGKDWTDKPNDFIQWSMDAEQNAPLSQRTSVQDLSLRILGINFAAIHTTSLAFTFAVLHLASRPELAEPLRKEIEMVIEKEGWTKVAMVQMKFLDSFLKESGRLNGVGATTQLRKVLKDFTFSDGTTVPAGTTVGLASWAIHRDESLYPNAKEFNPFRFSDMRLSEGESTKHQLVTPTLDWSTFGQGRHSCPGRFFASAELKTLLAHVLLNYDVKLPNDSREVPSHFKFLINVGPNENAKVLFRKRKTA